MCGSSLTIQWTTIIFSSELIQWVAIPPINDPAYLMSFFLSGLYECRISFPPKRHELSWLQATISSPTFYSFLAHLDWFSLSGLTFFLLIWIDSMSRHFLFPTHLDLSNEQTFLDSWLVILHAHLDWSNEPLPILPSDCQSMPTTTIKPITNLIKWVSSTIQLVDCLNDLFQGSIWKPYHVCLRLIHSKGSFNIPSLHLSCWLCFAIHSLL